MLIALAGATAAPVARAQAPADWHTAVQQLLEKRARGVMAGDRAAFDATMSLAPRAFRAAKDTWFSRMRALPLGPTHCRSTPTDTTTLPTR